MFTVMIKAMEENHGLLEGYLYLFDNLTEATILVDIE